jgi:catechol 2,3-dioxygenase-like lactoylglutathione lyase family enzyme
MNIVGLDELVFGVDDVAGCGRFLVDYGLTPVEEGVEGGRYVAVDGTGIVIRSKDDAQLPAALSTGNMLRKTVYGVADEATLQAIVEELGRDREVKRLADGSIESYDDLGFALGFRVTVRKPVSVAGERVNAPGTPQRQPNELGVTSQDDAPPLPLTLSHVVYFVPDANKNEAFYVNRLGFRVTDRFIDAGVFLQPGGMLDHHSLFFIQTPPHMQGCEHFTFHMSGPTDVLRAGTRFVNKGYQSFWGPGRHKFGSNWFWYFNSPMGCHIEYDADMDLHDATWQPRVAPMVVDNSQIFLFQWREKFAPGGPAKAPNAPREAEPAV